MSYDWEENTEFKKALECANEHIPEGYTIVGVIVGRIDTGEGAAIIDGHDNDLWDADVFKDALSDLEDAYGVARENAFRKKPRAH